MKKRILCFAVLLAHLAAAGAARATAAPAGPGLPGGAASARIPFETANNHIYLRVRVNGSGPLWFLFDTGAEATCVDLARAKALGLRLEGRLEMHGSGEAAVAGALVKDVAIDVSGARVSGQTAVAIPLAPVAAFDGREMDGILGYDFTSQFVVEIDYAAKRIGFYDPKTYVYRGKGDRLAIDLVENDNDPRVRATITSPDGESIEGVFTIDTGSRNPLSLNTPFVASHAWVNALAERAIPAPFGVGLGGETKTRVGRIGSLRLGRYAVENLVTGFETATSGSEGRSDFAGNIGAEVLRRFTVVFDYSRKAMYLEPNADFAAPTEYDMLGVMMKLDGPGVTIQRVVERSPAAEAGLRPGDVVVAADGRPATTLEQLRRLFRSGPGRAVTLRVRRGAETTEVTVTLRRLV